MGGLFRLPRAHYAETQLQRKRDAVTRMLDRIRPAHVLDVGTNGGEFANLAARGGSRVVSIDMDLDALRAARSAAVKQSFKSCTSTSTSRHQRLLSVERRRMPVVRSESARSFRRCWRWRCCTTSWCPDGSPGRSTVEAGSYTRSHLIIEYVDPPM